MAMAAAGCRLYVYYRVSRANEERAVAAAQDLQARLLARLPGLQAQLLRRVAAAGVAWPGQSDDASVTLMEVYTAAQGVDDAWVAEIEAEAARLHFETWASPRHLELFQPCG